MEVVSNIFPFILLPAMGIFLFSGFELPSIIYSKHFLGVLYGGSEFLKELKVIVRSCIIPYQLQNSNHLQNKPNHKLPTTNHNSNNSRYKQTKDKTKRRRRQIKPHLVSVKRFMFVVIKQSIFTLCLTNYPHNLRDLCLIVITAKHAIQKGWPTSKAKLNGCVCNKKTASNFNSSVLCRFFE